jgi:hypothetical protein
MIVRFWLLYLALQRIIPQISHLFRRFSTPYTTMGSCICPVKNEQASAEQTGAPESSTSTRTTHTSVSIVGSTRHTSDRTDHSSSVTSNCHCNRDSQSHSVHHSRHSHSGLNHRHYNPRNGQAMIDSLVLETLQLIRTLIDTYVGFNYYSSVFAQKFFLCKHYL